MVNLESNRLTFCGFAEDATDARVLVYGAPYDSTCSFRPGTRFAPARMREESFGLETYSPYQDLDLLNYKVYDLGDLELPFGVQTKTLQTLEEQTAQILAKKAIPLMIGGEHLLTLGPVRECVKHYPNLEIVHFDAHTDLRDDYLGNELSHASVIKRCWELVGDQKIHSFGIRSGLKEEFAFAKEHLDFHPLTLDDASLVAEKLASAKTPIYLTLDLDVLDPSVLPGTGTPEPGGATFMQLLNALLAYKDCNIVGIDIMELSPHYDQSGVSTAAACKILRELCIMLASK